MLSRARFRIFTALTLSLFATLLVASASSAVALPLYLGKIGNFQVSADAIRGQDFGLALAIDGNSGTAGGQLPVGEVTLGRAQIDGLLLEKEFDLSRVLGSPGGGTWKLSISTSGTTTATNLRIDAAGICADSIAFGPGFAVDGKGAGTPSVSDDLSLGASTISLGKPGIEATYLTTRQIRLAGIRIDVKREGYTLARCARAGR